MIKKRVADCLRGNKVNSGDGIGDEMVSEEVLAHTGVAGSIPYLKSRDHSIGIEYYSYREPSFQAIAGRHP
jgi:hypothetical protein